MSNNDIQSGIILINSDVNQDIGVKKCDMCISCKSNSVSLDECESMKLIVA